MQWDASRSRVRSQISSHHKYAEWSAKEKKLGDVANRLHSLEQHSLEQLLPPTLSSSDDSNASDESDEED
jgi:hypothetical protein